MSIPVPLIGKATIKRVIIMASDMPADSSENLQPSQRNDGPEPATTVSYRQQGGSTVGEEDNVYLDVFAMFFKEHNLKKVA